MVWKDNMIREDETNVGANKKTNVRSKTNVVMDGCMGEMRCKRERKRRARYQHFVCW